MNNQKGRVLTPSVAKELIQELFAGQTVRQTVKRQEIIKSVDKVHRERGGEPAKSAYHPVERVLTSMKKSGLAENPEHGLWCIFSEESSQSEKSAQIKTLDGFMKWARKFDLGEYVFRGVPNAGYGIQASAYRRPDEEDRNFEKFFYINKDLIREARLRGYDQKEGRELKELEILADLQHFQAATCLIDFSYSSQVALWFACQPSPDGSQDKTQNCEKSQNGERPQDCQASPNGKVFAVLKRYPKFQEITPELLNETIDHFFTDRDDSQLYHWQPRQQNHRIIAQQSIFLFGNYEFDPDDECVIAGDSKEDILKELQKVSGITKDILFPDLEGFARVRGEDAPYTELTPSEYRKRGFLAYERKDYKDAIADYGMAINKNPEYTEVYYLRGRARKLLGQQAEAIADFKHAIRLDPEYVEAHKELTDMQYVLDRTVE